MKHNKENIDRLFNQDHIQDEFAKEALEGFNAVDHSLEGFKKLKKRLHPTPWKLLTTLGVITSVSIISLVYFNFFISKDIPSVEQKEASVKRTIINITNESENLSTIEDKPNEIVSVQAKKSKVPLKKTNHTTLINKDQDVVKTDPIAPDTIELISNPEKITTEESKSSPRPELKVEIYPGPYLDQTKSYLYRTYLASNNPSKKKLKMFNHYLVKEDYLSAMKQIKYSPIFSREIHHSMEKWVITLGYLKEEKYKLAKDRIYEINRLPSDLIRFENQLKKELDMVLGSQPKF